MINQLPVIELDGDIESTEDCKAQLNEKIAKRKWKRLYKLGDLRCFTNELKEFVTIAQNGEGNWCAYVGVNAENEIRTIRSLAKFYWTTDDYGDIFWNPWTKEIWIVGSDGGYGYSVAPLKNVDEDFWETYDHEGTFKEFNTHPGAEFIKTVHWEAESSPYVPEPEDLVDEEDENNRGYMLVGKIQNVD